MRISDYIQPWADWHPLENGGFGLYIELFTPKHQECRECCGRSDMQMRWFTFNVGMLWLDFGVRVPGNVHCSCDVGCPTCSTVGCPECQYPDD